MSEAVKEDVLVLPPPRNGGELGPATLGFVLAFVLAAIAASALFQLIFVSFVPRSGRFIAIAMACSIGICQAAYAVPLYFWAIRRGARSFAAGLRSGAISVLLLNALFLALVALWPGFED